MSLTHWLSNRRGLSFQPASGRKTPAARRTVGPRLEFLEDRVALSTLTVLNHLDSGAGSLRAEIAAAHSGDTIVFAPSLDGQTITLTSGELLIKKDLTIAGPGAGELTVSGNHASRVFEVTKGTQVSLSGLTISNGLVAVTSSDDGGGIENYGKLMVSGSTLSANSASNYGGGIFNGGSGTLTVSNSTLSANVATNGGGGIFNDGTVTVSGSTLSGNSADVGGGVYNLNGTVTVSGSTLSANSASNYGGGIFNSLYGTATVKNSSIIIGNTAPVGFGADIYNPGVLYLDSSIIISSSILDGNPAVRI